MKAVRGLGLALMLLLIVSPALAAVPSTLSFQGLLTNGAGTPLPDGSYDLSFRLYAAASGGTALWTEAQTGVPVTSGTFAVILGSTTPLSLAFDAQLWLGIAVNADPEMTPRVALTASPYALSLRLPFASPDRSVQLDDGSSARATLSGHDSPGFFVRHSPDSTATVELFDLGAPGGQLITLSPSIAITAVIGSDHFTSDNAGLCNVSGRVGSQFISLRGSAGTGNNPLVLVQGSASTIRLDAGATGNASVVLPVNAVASTEVLDEPGIAQGKVNGTVVVNVSANMTDVVTTTLTIPADGYIVVDASGEAKFSGTTLQNLIGYQIDETAGGGTDVNQQRVVGSDQPPNLAAFYTTLAAKRTYFKTAGTYTFRLEAVKGGDVAGVSSISRPTITASYFPTSYGTVASVASGGDQRAVDFRSAPNAAGGAEALVDLRVLELRAARERDESERAQRELLDARVRADHEAMQREATERARSRSASRPSVPTVSR